MRLHITGNAGAGKTTLAKTLATELGLPLYHLDQIAWLPGWRKPDTETRKRNEVEITQGQHWIIEGVSDIVRAKADLTLFIDKPRHTCMMRCFKRNMPYLFKSRPELPEQCPEILIVGKLLSIIWKFPFGAGARIAADASRKSNVVRIEDSSSAHAVVQDWITTVTPNKVLQRDALGSALLGCGQAARNSSALDRRR